MNNYQSIGKIG